MTLGVENDRRRDPDQGRAGDRQEGRERGQEAEDDRRGQPDDLEGDPHERSLDERRRERAEDDRPHDRRQARHDGALARLRQRDEGDRAAEHLLAVAEEEVEDEEHQEESHDRSDRAEHDLPAARDHDLERAARRVDEPVLDLRGRERRLLVDPMNYPPESRDVEEILGLLDLVFGGESREPRQQVRRLLDEGQHQESRGNHDSERHRESQEKRGETPAAAQPVLEPAVDRKEQEGEERRPEDRSEE